MDIPRHLRDIYRFPGLVPSACVRGYPGVEHWYPGARFPSETPVLGIAEVAR